jgi:multicomponent Na+:H+ antiporter subunit E
MTEALTVIGIALLWSFLLGSMSAFNLFIGTLLGILLLTIVQRDRGDGFPKRFLAFLRFTFRFLIEVVIANIAIARLAILPRPDFHPHIIAVPLRVKSDAAISLLAATITLLPGTVAMGVSEDKQVLFAHAIGEADIEKSRDSVVRIETLILAFMT